MVIITSSRYGIVVVIRNLCLPFPLSTMSLLHPPVLACLQPFRKVLRIMAEMVRVIRQSIAVNSCGKKYIS